MTPNEIVVVGASVAGMRAVETLRERGHDGAIVLLDADPELPYDRPPLSKELLSGELDEDDIRLADADRLAELGVEVRLGVAAISLDLRRRRLGTTEGAVPFDALLLAVGSAALRPRGWPELDGVHVLRTLADARRIGAELAAGTPRVVIIGGGFIGCEIAVAARARGLDTTIVEAQDLPMQRVLGAQLAAPVVALHREHGVAVRCGSAVARLVGAGRIEQVELADGTVLPADLVVIGVGAAPATGWLVGSGLDVTDGIATDRMLRTAAPGVYAAGDAACWAGPDGPTRVEHWTNAREQGARAAANLVRPSAAEPFDHVPYVWSDQYERRLQIAGRIHGGRVRFVHGSGDNDGGDATSFLAVIEDAGATVGVVGLDRPREFTRARRLLTDAAATALAG